MTGRDASSSRNCCGTHCISRLATRSKSRPKASPSPSEPSARGHRCKRSEACGCSAQVVRPLPATTWSALVCPSRTHCGGPCARHTHRDGAPHALDLLVQHLVALRTRGAPCRIPLSCAIRVIAGRCDRQDSADRLDTVRRARFIDERVHQRVRRSSSRSGHPAARTRPRTGVLLRLQQPPPERLVRASALRGDRRDGGPVGRIVRQWLANQSDSPFTNLRTEARLNRGARVFAMISSLHKVERPVIPGRFSPGVRKNLASEIQ